MEPILKKEIHWILVFQKGEKSGIIKCSKLMIEN